MESPIRFLFSDIKAGDLGDDKIVTTPEDCQLRVYLIDYPDINEKKFYNRLLSFLKKESSLSGYIDDGSIILELNVHRFIEGGTVDLADDRNQEFVNKIIENSWIYSKRKLKTSAFLGGTDFFAFNNYGDTPAIVFGPGGGNCHAADEYVNVKDLMDISKIYAGLIYDYCC